MRRLALLLPLALIAAPAMARDSLGVFGQWGAFRDVDVPRCYAIAATEASASDGSAAASASVGTWPRLQVRGQLHFRLSRDLQAGTTARLAIGGQRFDLAGSGRNAFAADRQSDAQIVAAMRAASSMQVSGRDSQGRLFTDRYSLDGAATAMDAATVGCARNP
ncbi:hypothetical protein M3P36_12035 [Altererythrobacter sp. KTW20L]|uniref:hypothetical protein n=1 Tax=Altererythrobacter sp. KTW20L TaxID=2942210 RepID=UPI0020C08045|nr:hypothetical protein [Altererythrobacter sp. KTW20L]MCL6251767.1 hypothetical protein [Altererythrobacter sp. KTW20L]